MHTDTIEVEMRAIIDENQVDSILHYIQSIDGEYSSEEIITDIYFCQRHVQSFEEIAMHDVGSSSLRIRESKKEKESTVLINTKTITTEGDFHAWEEHEIKTDSFNESWKILEAIGFKAFFYI